jgi:uncharacterized protein (DUF2147 family)
MSAMKYLAPAFLVFTLVPAVLESASAAPDPTGVWLNDTGRGAVEIKPCGNNLCGNVVWVKSTTDTKGCGKQIIGDVAPVGGGVWDNGWIYSPEKGRKYDVELTPLSDGTLKVTGYAGMKFLSKTMIWKRAPQDLQRCGETQAKLENSGTKSDATESAPAAPEKAPEKQAASDAAAPATNPAPAPEAKSDGDKPKAETPSADSGKAAAPETPAAADEETASADDTGDKDIGKTLNGLGLDKVLTRTKSGKCKLDLPWFKVTLNCKQEEPASRAGASPHPAPRKRPLPPPAAGVFT